jgi:hypothetical protein
MAVLLAAPAGAVAAALRELEAAISAVVGWEWNASGTDERSTADCTGAALVSEGMREVHPREALAERHRRLVASEGLSASAECMLAWEAAMADIEATVLPSPPLDYALELLASRPADQRKGMLLEFGVATGATLKTMARAAIAMEMEEQVEVVGPAPHTPTSRPRGGVQGVRAAPHHVGETLAAATVTGSCITSATAASSSTLVTTKVHVS